MSSDTALVSGLTLAGQEDIFVLKYDDAGTLQSQWSFGTTSKDVANCMTVDSSDNIFVAGSTEGDWPGQSKTNTFGVSRTLSCLSWTALAANNGQCNLMMLQ